MTAQPKPPAADVAADHIRCTATRVAVPESTPFGEATMTCGAPLPPAGRDFHAAHITERLAAAGLLATVEHDAQMLRDAAKAWMTEVPPGCDADDWGRGWLACRDAMVYDLGTTRADRIAGGAT